MSANPGGIKVCCIAIRPATNLMARSMTDRLFCAAGNQACLQTQRQAKEL
jgi:hypothetical protein